VLEDLQTLCTLGLAGGRTDGELIALFVGSDPQASKRAFSILVDRHGPMVFGVCRRVLGDQHAAEDALQATFLVFAKRARSIRRQESVGGWLHRVARRIAVRAGKAARRRQSTQDVGAHVETLAEVCDPGQSLERSELRTVLDKEIDRLDLVCRQVVVLCDLEGLTHDQAAERLRWPVGTVKSRLSRARNRLRERLVRRGFGPAILGGAGTLWGGEATAALSSSLAQAVVKTALSGLTGTHVVPAVVASLARNELRAVATSKIRVVMSMLLVLGGSVAVWSLVSAQGFPARSPKKLVTILATAVQAAVAGDNAPRKVSASGRVVDTQGRPVANARVFIREWIINRTGLLSRAQQEETHRTGQLPDILAQTKTDADGRFRFEDVNAPAFPGTDSNRYLGKTWFPWDLIVLAEGHGVAWARLTPQNQRDALTMTLPQEASLRGRVTTSDGKPISGARIRAFAVTDLRAEINEFQSKEDRLSLDWSSIPIETQTDGNGRFVLGNLVSERRIALWVRAEGFERATLFAATTADPQPDLENRTFHDSRVTLTHYPVQTGDLRVTLKKNDHQLLGRLVFEGTERPVVGASVRVGYADHGRTDQDGRFTARDLVAGTIELHTRAKDQDWAPLDVAVEIPEAPKVVERTFQIPRGLAVSGRVEDDQGGGIAGVKLRYETVSEGQGIPTLFGLQATTDSKGRFRLNVPAGPGKLVIFEAPRGYLGPGGRFVGSAPEGRFSRPVTGASGTVINDLTFSLGQGGRITVQVRDSENRPVKGAEARRYGLRESDNKPLFTDAEGRVQIIGLDSESAYTIDLIHPTRRIGGRVEVSPHEARESKEGIRLKLEPLGSLEGHVLDENGKPLLGPVLWLRTLAKSPDQIGAPVESRHEVKSDGFFRFDGLIPNASYYVDVEVAGHAGQISKTIDAEAGATRRLEPFRLPITNRSLKGIVVDPRDQPVAGAKVSFDQSPSGLHNSGGRWFMETDATGRFELTGLPQGELSIMAYRTPTGPDRSIRNLVREKVGASQADVRLVLPDVRRRLQGIED